MRICTKLKSISALPVQFHEELTCRLGFAAGLFVQRFCKASRKTLPRPGTVSIVVNAVQLCRQVALRLNSKKTKEYKETIED